MTDVWITERCPAPMGEGMYEPGDSPVETTGDHAQYLEEKGYGEALETKDDWYEAAQKLGVPGRSSMSKDELISAVKAA